MPQRVLFPKELPYEMRGLDAVQDPLQLEGMRSSDPGQDRKTEEEDPDHPCLFVRVGTEREPFRAKVRCDRGKKHSGKKEARIRIQNEKAPPPGFEPGTY